MATILIAVLGVGGVAASVSAADRVASPYWPSLIAQGSVAVGYRWDINDLVGEVTTRSGRILARIDTSDPFERLLASGRHAMWIVKRVLDPNFEATSDQVVVGNIYGAVRARVVSSCFDAYAVAAINGTNVAYGCDAAFIDGGLTAVSAPEVHLGSLLSGTNATVATDGSPIAIAMSARYAAVAVDTTGAVYAPQQASKEVEVVDVRSMRVVSRIVAADWIQSLAISGSGTVAMVEGQTPAPLDELHGAFSEPDLAYGGDPCSAGMAVVAVPLGGTPLTIDSRACPYPLAATSSGFVYPRIQGRGAALVDTDAGGRRTILQLLGRAHGLLSLYQTATAADTVLYAEGTCQGSGGAFGVSAFTETLSKRTPPSAAPPVGCPVTGRLPGRVRFAGGRSPKVFRVSIACPRGCAPVTVTLDPPHSDDAGDAGGGTLAGVMPRHYATVKVTCNSTCSGANRPRSLFATIKSPDRTGTDVVYARRTIRITY
jgi:hypothetical protein